MVTRYPGFRDAVQDAQQTFRVLLDAIARPGCTYAVGVEMEPPAGMVMGCAAACLTLLDLDVSLWMQPGWHEAVRSWLLFHTGCRVVTDGAIANFALIHTWDTTLRFADFQLGTAEDPEHSTTLLIQLEQMVGGTPKTLSGPGIQSHQPISPHLPQSFWDDWTRNHQIYPLGVDVFLFHHQTVMGLPRSTLAVSDP